MASFSNLTIGIAVASFTVFQLLFHFLSSWVSTRITPGFKNLSQKRKIEWNSRTVSTFHALVVGGFCLYILLYDDAVNADPLWGDPSIVKLNIAITTGYLISDLLLIIFYWKAIGDKFFVIHHLAALYAYYFVLSKGLLAYFGNFRLLAEFSTPFVNQRWFFEVLGYPRSSKANIVNGVLMTVVFFVVRIAVMPVYYSHVISSFGTEGFQRLGFAAQSAWIISSVVLDIMNVMWMVKIAKGCCKVICLIGREEAKTHRNGKSA
ncbi:TLC domain-containing protein 4 [Catharus ustulatus]|uniref:TLC domain-containing protein n=1 Tax=Catharus ustulatus TaxID=91951 RepID=A0A8C3TRN6_CATUS|nr:TLC domain-containing protein 4 [Catharus ustulatus]XP_032922937.1 TLC domain-containing protein 4 [Catharus ustulatus]XP_032922939.1 TLC domain-containing protein 4 [Catharus ustulatus]